MSEPQCKSCGALAHAEFEPETGSEPSKEAYALADGTLAAAIAEPHRTFIAEAFQAVIEQRAHEFEMSESFRVRAEKAEADAVLAWRRVTELQERGTELVEQRRTETERCAGICDRLALLREHGAGEIDPGGRLRQAARLIRGGGK